MPDLNNLPNPEDLTDEQLDQLLETGQLPDPEEDKNKGDDAAEDEDTTQDEDKGENSDEDDNSGDDDDSEDNAGNDDDKDDDDQNKDDKPTDDKQPSRREQRRVRDLLEKYGKPEAPKTQAPKAEGIDYSKELEADEQTVQRFADDRQTAVDNAYKEGLGQMNFLQFQTNLKIDAPRVEQKYPQLDKNSDQFKPEAASDFNLLFLRLAEYNGETQTVGNPNFSYEEFADSIFGLANELADIKAETTVKQVKKQAAQTGLRPDGSGAKKLDLNKAPEDMTDEELDEYLKQAIPQR